MGTIGDGDGSGTWYRRSPRTVSVNKNRTSQPRIAPMGTYDGKTLQSFVSIRDIGGRHSSNADRGHGTDAHPVLVHLVPCPRSRCPRSRCIDWSDCNHSCNQGKGCLRFSPRFSPRLCVWVRDSPAIRIPAFQPPADVNPPPYLSHFPSLERSPGRFCGLLQLCYMVDPNW